jgi:hypothetical protein
MESAVLFDQGGGFRLEQLAKHVLARFGVQMGVQAGNGRFEPVGKNDVTVAGSFRSAAIWADRQAVCYVVTELAKPGERRFLDVALGDPVHAAASTIFSASRRQISPDISFGSNKSRLLARLRAS